MILREIFFLNDAFRQYRSINFRFLNLMWWADDEIQYYNINNIDTILTLHYNINTIDTILTLHYNINTIDMLIYIWYSCSSSWCSSQKLRSLYISVKWNFMRWGQSCVYAYMYVTIYIYTYAYGCPPLKNIYGTVIPQRMFFPLRTRLKRKPNLII